MKKAVFYVLMFLLATVVPLTLAEVGLRLYLGDGMTENALRERLRLSSEASVGEAGDRSSLFGLVRPSVYRDVIYELKPNLDATFRDQPLVTNSYGLRDREYEPEKPAGTFRIVGLGDSHMFGWSVAYEDTYLARIERSLNEDGAGRRFEVVNCATPGYNTAMEVAIYEHKCAAFDPDLIVIHFTGDDLSLPHFLQPPRGTSPARWYLVELVRTAFAGGAEDDAGLVADNRELSEEAREEVQEPYQHMVGAAGYRRAMSRLADLVAERSIPVLVLMVGKGGKRRLARQVSESHGFEVLDLAPYLYEHLLASGVVEPGQEDWRDAFKIGSHPNALANAVYAEAVLPRLREMIEGRSPS